MNKLDKLFEFFFNFCKIIRFILIKIHNKINVVIGYVLLLIICVLGAIFRAWNFKDKYRENMIFIKKIWKK
jgi:hypothetical protein